MWKSWKKISEFIWKWQRINYNLSHTIIAVKIVTLYVVLKLLNFIILVIEYYFKCHVKRENDPKKKL